MKKVLTLLSFLILFGGLNAQTVLFHENFDDANDSVTSSSFSGTSFWEKNTRLFYNGSRCDTNFVTQNDTSYLTTSSFSTMGYSYVFLSFAHICKIQLLDAAIIEVSLNNGPWVKLTSAQYIDPGNSQFVSQGNKFSSNTYPIDWLPLQPAVKPLQSWWKQEQFDLSAIAGNQANVRLRFTLIDANGDGSGVSPNATHGWYLDAIRVTGSTSELTPPSVTMKPPVIQDTVTNTGPFDIYAWISDLSGIDTAYIVYQLNNGPAQYIPMLNISDSTWLGTIPSYTWNQRIDYYVRAIDASPGQNPANGPNQWFYTFNPPAGSVIIGTGTSASTSLPTNGFYDWSWGAQVYLASELNFTGLVDSIYFFVGNTPSNYTMINQKVFIGHYSQSTFGTAMPDTSGMTVAYLGSCTYNGGGWHGFKLQNAFNYNGVDNILIYWLNRDGDYVTGYPTFCYTSTTPDYRAAYKNSDTYSVVFPVSTGTNTYNRPNVKIRYQQYTPQPSDAGITQISQPVGVIIANQNHPVVVSLKNFGADTLVKATIKWTLNGAPQPDYLWTGMLPAAVTSTPITIGTVNVPAGPHNIVAWSVLPNDSTDMNFVNDTATRAFYACDSLLTGTYTIGPGGDFPTFNAARTSIMNCGIGGPVTFNVFPGNYVENLSLPQIAGASSVNTITFQSSTGIASDVTLEYTATSTANNYVIDLDGADWFRFRNMTLEANGSAFATVIKIGNIATNNIFQGNIIRGKDTTLTSTNTALVYSASGATSLDSVNTFDGNTFYYGSYGMYFYGQGSGGVTQLENKTVVSNNQFINQYYRGMVLYYQNSPVIENNIITTNTANTSYYGIQAGYCDYDLRILKNKITMYNGGYGIYIYYCDGASGNEGLTANNFVSIGGTSTTYGIYDYYSSFQDIFFNSVNVYSNAATARAFMLSGSTTYLNNRMRNNIFAYTGSNTAGYAIYISTTAAVSSSNYNNLFSTGTNLGYWTSARANLAAWQSGSGQDTNSVSANPGFTSPINLHTYSINVSDLGQYLSIVPDDIDGQARSLTTPDIGADEFTLLAHDVGIDSVSFPVSGCALSSAENVTIRIRNTGLNTANSFQISYVLNNGTPVTETWNGTLNSGASMLYTFTSQPDLSAYGNYTMDFYLNYPADLNSMNDSLLNHTFYSGWNFLTAAYTQSFEPPAEYFDDWSVANPGGGTYTWEISYNSTTYSRTGARSCRFYNGSSNTGDDWLFSRCFPLQAGNTYKISFWYRGGSTSTASSLDLNVGTSATPAAMTTNLVQMPAILSTTYQQRTVLFTPTTTGTYYFGWRAYSAPSSTYMYIDDINIEFVPDQDAQLLGIFSPVDGCSLSNAEAVTVQIRNSGADTINGNLTAYYSINGSAPVSEAVSQMILPADTLSFTFATTVDMSVTTQDSLFSIVSWVNLLNDPISLNDSAATDVLSSHIPYDPLVMDDTVFYGNPATLMAFSADSIYWYDVPSGGNSLHIGSTYVTVPLFDTVTYYVQAATGGADLKITEITQYRTGTGQTPSYPSWATGADMIEITNLGSASANMQGFVFEIVGTGARTYTFPSVAVGSGETVILCAGSGTDSPANRYFNTGGSNDVIQSASTTGFILKDNTGTIVDVVAVNGYSFAAGSGVTANDWSGSIPSSSGKAGVIRVVSDNNLASDWVISNTPSPLQTIGALNPTLTLGGGSGCASNRVPVTAYVVFPSDDAAVTAINSPMDACTFGSENVSIDIYNNGNTPITDLIAGYINHNAGTTVYDTLSGLNIAPQSNFAYTFASPGTFNVLTGDSTFNLSAFVILNGDGYSPNDTVSTSFVLSFSPPDPVGTNDTVLYGNTATLTATSPYPMSWFNVPSGGTVLDTGSVFITPVLYGTTPFYVEAGASGPDLFVGPYDNTIGAGGAVNYTTYHVIFDVLAPNGATIKSVDVFPGVGPGAAYTIHIQNSALQEIAVYSGVTTVATNMRETIPVNFSLPQGTDYRIGFTVMPNMYRNTAGAVYPYTIPNVISIKDHTFTGYPAYYYYFYNWKVSSGSGCPSHRIPVYGVVTGQPPLDAALVGITSPTAVTSLGTHDVDVVLQNYGSDTIVSAQIGWSLNGVAQTPYSWTGVLPSGATDTVTISSHNFVYTPYPANNSITAWVYNPNNGVDATPNNDTTSLQFQAFDPYNGIYYIRTATPDFNSFSDASLALADWGVSGPVTILADTGLYVEQPTFGVIPGTSASARVTFSSITGNAADVTLQFAAATSTNNWVLHLNDAEWLNFENLTIKSTTTNNYGRVVVLSNGASRNEFRNNIIQTISSTSSTNAGVYSASTNESNNIFEGNQIINGYYGVYFYGASAARKTGNRFINNSITGFYYYGIYLGYNDSVYVQQNVIQNGPSSGTMYAVYNYYGGPGSVFSKNKIHGAPTTTFYGLYMSSVNGIAGAPVVVSNNFISQSNSTGTAYGMYLTGSNFINIYHNSVNISAGSSTGGRGVYQTGGTSGINMVNNNFANTGGGYAYYVSTPAAIGVSNYNNLYSSGSTLAYWSADMANLTLLRAASGKETNSVSANPSYYSVTDLHTYQFSLFGAGTPLVSVPDDIDGDIRSITAPCIGADEFMPPPVDAGVVSIDEPFSPAISGPQDLKVSIRNFGFDTIFNVTIAYTVNGVPGTPYAWSGALASGQVASNVVVGSINLGAGNTQLKAWTEMPNGVVDNINANDTAYSNVIVCNGALAGTYTLGGSNPDFPNFATAKDALIFCGVSGPVVFEVASGSYNEQISLPAITGASAINTITFRSASGIASSVTLQYAANGTNDNYIVRLDGADYFRFENMTLQSNTSTNYGRVVVLTGNANYNEFNGNIIRSVSSTSSNAAGIYSTDFTDNFNKFVNNEILYGYYGVYFRGSSTSVMKKGNVFENNNITGWYYYGMYLYYNDSVTVRGNTIINGSNTGTGYGIYSYYGENGSSYTKNKILCNNTSTFYGLTVGTSTGNNLQPTLVANNFISQSVGTGTAYGIYLTGANYVDVIYNTVNITGGSATAGRGLYQSGGTNGVRIFNNIFVNTGSGYAYYIGTPAAVVKSDYNNYFAAGTKLAYWSGDHTTLTSLQTTNAKDSASINVDPGFYSATDLHVVAAQLDGAAQPVAFITEDIDGDVRNALTPDIGADEFQPLSKDIGIIAFLQPQNLFAAVGGGDTVEIRIRNFGADTVYSFNVSYKYASNPAVNATWSGILLPNQVTNFFFATPLASLAGSQSLCAYVALAGDQNTANDTLCTHFTGVPVISVPYSDNFEGNMYWYAQGSGGLWEYGTPSASVINSAYSPVTAWATNLDGDYLPSATEFLYSPYFSFTQVSSAQLGFWHWVHTESGQDGGRLQYSLNGGQTWISLGVQNDPNGTNWYNSVVNGVHMFTGSTGGWVYSSYNLSTIPAIVNAVNPVQFRYLFSSNASNSNFNGWAVDNFSITVPPLPKDAGVISIDAPTAPTQIGAAVNVSVKIRNFGTDTLTTVPVAYSINGLQLALENFNGLLMPDSVASYNFTTTYTGPAATYRICAYTKLVGDTYFFNDTTCSILGTTPANLDAGIGTIVSPLTQTNAGDSVTVSVWVKNYGLNTLTSMPVGYKRSGIQVAYEIWNGNLAFGDSVIYTFNTKFISPLSNYSICAFTALTNDANTGNDESCVYPEGVTGLDEYGSTAFVLGQNMPNPAGNITLIPVSLPYAGKIRFTVYDAVGKMIHEEMLSLDSGSQQIRFDVSGMNAGLYFYSVEFGGNRQSKRMVIKR